MRLDNVGVTAHNPGATGDRRVEVDAKGRFIQRRGKMQVARAFEKRIWEGKCRPVAEGGEEEEEEREAYLLLLLLLLRVRSQRDPR